MKKFVMIIVVFTVILLGEETYAEGLITLDGKYSVSKDWTITFNTAIDSETMYDGISITDKNGNDYLAYFLSTKNDGTKIVIDNHLEYKYDKEYLIKISSELKTLNGESVKEATFKFVTEESPEKPKDIKTLSQLIKYLNEEYSVLHTPAGKWELSHSIAENDSNIFGHDYWIQTDWSSLNVSPYDLEYSIKLSKDEKEKTKALLTKFQKEVADFAIKSFPNKKFKGGFHTGYYKYPNLRVDYKTIKFLSWRNYNEASLMEDDRYNNSDLSEFTWDTELDDYDLLNKSYNGTIEENNNNYVE